MGKRSHTDYETYCEIMGELLRPIAAGDLDADTLKRLYESKLVYLENLRVKSFRAINGPHEASGTGHFTKKDYALILQAIVETRRYLRQVVLMAITTNLSKRKAV